jgi:hypothetical protein
MHCQRIAAERLRVTAEDMPAGAEVRLRSDGFDFTPYVVRTRVLGRLSVGLRCLDSVQLMDDGRMIDTIEARLFGICVARVRIVLRRSRRWPRPDHEIRLHTIMRLSGGAASELPSDVDRETIRKVASGLWLVAAPLRFLGIEIGRWMTIVRLGSGALLLHSPAPLTDGLRASLDSVGKPRFVVAASALHGHRFMEQYRDAYPDAELFAAPGLDRRRKDLAFDGLLGSTPDRRWSNELDQAVFLWHQKPAGRPPLGWNASLPGILTA